MSLNPAHANAGGARDELRTQASRTRSNGKTGRIHISLPDTLMTRLQEIQRDTHATTLTEVFKDALVVYAALLEEHKRGNGVFIESGDGTQKTRFAVFL